MSERSDSNELYAASAALGGLIGKNTAADLLSHPEIRDNLARAAVAMGRSLLAALEPVAVPMPEPVALADTETVPAATKAGKSK